jgi:two-component system nitrogen regulation response regulator GlnG
MDELTRRFEKALIVRALTQTGGRRIEAAHLLGLGRNTLTRKIQELEVNALLQPGQIFDAFSLGFQQGSNVLERPAGGAAIAV